MSDPVHRETNADFLSDIFPRVIPSSRVADAARGCGRLDKDASHYRMDYSRRGVAAIFNQVGCAAERSCVGNDIGSLFNTFTRLGFEIETFNDLDFCEIECAIENLSQRDHSDSDCFVLVYLSRGAEGKLRARDRFFDVNCLWGCFTAENSPTLANKPKVFIVHGYRELPRGRSARHGGLCDDCALVDEADDPESGPGSDRLRSYYIPDRSDFLIILSTVQGMVCPRQSHRVGSLYIQTLCQHLDCVGFYQDMMTILTEVNRQILDLANDSSITSCHNCKKQLPTIISLLIRILQFTEKTTASRVKRIAFGSEESSDEEGYREVEEDSASQRTPNKKKKTGRSVSGPKQSEKINK